MTIWFDFQRTSISMQIKPPIGKWAVEDGSSMIYIGEPFDELEQVVNQIINYFNFPNSRGLQ
jgi:hypothetical protein